MAKTGFDFYRVDTDRYQDIRIKKLKKHHGCSGIAVYDYVLCEIYRVKGCFMEWDESTAYDVAEYFGLKETTVNEIIRYCGSVGLFDKELLSRGIVTSASIQKRYLEMCRLSRRTNATIPNAYRIGAKEPQQPIAQQPPQPIGSAGAVLPASRPVSSDTVTGNSTSPLRSDTVAATQPPPTVTIQELINHVSEDDYWEAMRLSSCGKPGIATDSILQWLTAKKQGNSTMEFYIIIQNLQRLENNGQLTTEQPNRFLWRAMVDIRKAYGVFTEQQTSELYTLASKKPNDFIAAVNEWKKNRNKINAPYQFIKSKLK